MESCIFCKIVQGKIPCTKLFENELNLLFMDIMPLAKGHALIVPKRHAEFLHELPETYLADIGILAGRLGKYWGSKGIHYNILQNNGRLAHQEVPHVHFHVIPKPSVDMGLSIQWDPLNIDKAEFLQEAEEMTHALSSSL